MRTMSGELGKPWRSWTGVSTSWRLFKPTGVYQIWHLVRLVLIVLQVQGAPEKWSLFKSWKFFHIFCTVKPLITNTLKEFIKCRLLYFLIMECSRILMAIYLFSQIRKFTKYSIKIIEKLSRIHSINSSDVFVIKGFTVWQWETTWI